jgi:hypothetical protein
MKLSKNSIRGALCAALTLASLLGAARARADVHAALIPAVQTVSLNTDFTLEIDVTPAGSAFNGFNAVVEYDTTAISFVGYSPVSLQEGCLMTGACSAACGSTFHRFTPAADSLSIRDFLLCDQIALTGPGQIYKLKFHAGNIHQTTTIRIRSATFFNAGLFVTPVTTSDAQVTVGLVGVGDGPRSTGLELKAEPNPARSTVRFAIASEFAGEQTLEIHDIGGRLVRRIESGWQPAGAAQASWDGNDAFGRRVSPGVYLVTLRSGEHAARVRVARIQ